MVYQRKTKEDLVLFVCDIQEKLRGKIKIYDDIIFVSNLLLKMAQKSGIPYHIVTVTRERNGELVKEIKDSLTQKEYDDHVFDKNSPTILDQNGINFLNKYSSRKTVILTGIETHVCIQQTVQDLSSLGYDTFLMMDTIGSQRFIDHKSALNNILKYKGVYTHTLPSFTMEVFGQKLDKESTMKNIEIFKLEYQNRKYFKNKNKEKLQKRKEEQMNQKQMIIPKL